MRARSILPASALVTVAFTDPLDEPPLAGSLDYLQKGLLQSLQPTNGWYTQWGPDWIPAIPAVPPSPGLIAMEVR